MAEAATIKCNIRTDVTKVEKKRLRMNGYLVGVISGKGKESVPVALSKDEFRKIFKKHGRKAVYRLESDQNNTYDVMVKEIQVSPSNYEYFHVDFQQVSL